MSGWATAPTEVEHAGFYWVYCDNVPEMQIVEFTGRSYNTFGQIGLNLEQLVSIYDIVCWQWIPMPAPPRNISAIAKVE